MNKFSKFNSKERIKNTIPKLNLKINKKENKEDMLINCKLKVSNSNRYFGKDISSSCSHGMNTPLMPLNTFNQKSTSISKKVRKLFLYINVL